MFRIDRELEEKEERAETILVAPNKLNNDSSCHLYVHEQWKASTQKAIITVVVKHFWTRQSSLEVYCTKFCNKNRCSTSCTSGWDTENKQETFRNNFQQRKGELIELPSFIASGHYMVVFIMSCRAVLEVKTYEAAVNLSIFKFFKLRINERREISTLFKKSFQIARQ